MGHDHAFCKLLGLLVGEFALIGGAIGEPAQPLEKRQAPGASRALGGAA